MDLYPIAKAIHEDHLRRSRMMRLYQRTAPDTPPFRKRLLLRLGDLLIAFAGALRARLKAYPAVQAQAHRPMNSPKL
jgi:hypothetical protein